MQVIGEQTALSRYKKLAMNRLILGFSGLEPSGELRRFVGSYDPFGYIVFARNVDNPQQVKDCHGMLQEMTKEPALLSVDQEGGRVRRFKNTPWPSMRVLGEIGDMDLAKKVIQGINAELLALGCNANWAPCADVDSNPQNPVIGDRSFARDPEVCAEFVGNTIGYMHELGVLACAKHFPGHGDTDVDSHLDLPWVHKTKEEIAQCELLPFQKAIQRGVQIMMTAHVMFPAFDTEFPATMSKSIIHDILRGQLGYTSVIVSDDMEMKAVRGRYPVEEQMDKSVRAGVDAFLVCSDPVLQEECFDALVRLQEKSAEHRQLAEQSFVRIQRIKSWLQQRHVHEYSLSMVGQDSHQRLCEQVMQRHSALFA